MVNAVTYAMKLVDDYGDIKTPTGKRQYWRSTFVIGGYLHEAIELVINLRMDYRNDPAFSSLMKLAFDDEYKFARKVLKAVRDNAAFHLDKDNKSTKKALQGLKLSRYDLASGDSDSMGDFYFDFADTVDWNYLIDEFKGNKTELETAVQIARILAEMMTAFLRAGHEFLVGLAEKLEIWRHTD